MKQAQYILLLLIWAFTFSNALSGQFHYDDQYFTEDTKYIKNGAEGLKNIWYDTGYGKPIVRPLAFASYNLSFTAFGEALKWWVLIGLCIHLAVVLLIRAIVFELTRDELLAWCTALLFLCSPITPYAIVYITQSRMEGMAAMFSLLSLWLYIKRRQLVWVLPLIAACLCKETGYITPLFICAYEWFYGSKKRAGAIIFVGAVILAVGIGYNQTLRYAVIGKDGWQTGLLAQTDLILCLDIACEYIKRIVLPLPQWLSIDPDYEYPQNYWLVWAVGLTAFSFLRCVNRDKIVDFVFVAIFISLAVPLLILPIKPDDKIVIYKAYLACFPVYFFVVLIIKALLPHGKTWVLGCLIMALVFACETRKINYQFSSPALLWEDASNENPHRLRAHYNAGRNIYLQEPDPELARKKGLEYTAKVIKEIDRRVAGKGETKLTAIEHEAVIKAWYNMGLIHEAHGDNEKAFACYFRAQDWPPATLCVQRICKKMGGDFQVNLKEESLFE